LIGEFNKDFRRNSDAEMQIGANDASLTYILPGVLSEFCKERPDTDVTLHRFEFEEGMDKLLYEEVEVFACPRRFSETPPKGVEYIPLFHYKPVLVTCPGHPLAGKEGLTIEEITQYDLTLPPRHLVALPGLHDFFPEKERKKKLRVDFNNWEVTHGYIATGLVVEVSSDIIVTGDKVAATSLGHIFPEVDYGFFVVEGVKHSKNLEVLIESARRYNKIQRAQKDSTRLGKGVEKS
jgi:DNA-binding transcriptional LysR family regulator